jgi:hypothetical protein
MNKESLKICEDYLTKININYRASFNKNIQQYEINILSSYYDVEYKNMQKKCIEPLCFCFVRKTFTIY